ncbi:YibE/F family protein [Streptosporangium sp. NPDC087985]|uniref:YibE/F family protein n=1 Tax=Streptosporangium sp. NPDC087985 TaxID=3366196 RepID=UPI0037FFE235
MAPPEDPLRTHTHAHAHTHGEGGVLATKPAGRRVLIVLTLVLAPLALATVVGMAVLWPERAGHPASGTASALPARELTHPEATVLTVSPYECPAINQRPGPTGPPRTVTCANVEARLETGREKGELVTVDVAAESYRAGLQAGDRIRLVRVFNHLAGPPTYGFFDHARQTPIGVLAIAFAVVVVAVARLRGLAALLGLGLAFLVLIKFMLPALLAGESPLLVGLVGSSAIMFVVLYLAHGFSARTTTALAGTLFGLLATAGLGTWAVNAVHLTGLADGDGVTLTALNGRVDLPGLVLCGIIVAGLGVLNDVTITQSSAVWELHELSPNRSARELFSSAMRIGRDHIASTVYTITFAYAGAALPILLLVDTYGRPLLDVVGSEGVAEEVVRTLVGSIGLVLAIPLTTAIAVLVVRSAAARERDQPSPSEDPA